MHIDLSHLLKIDCLIVLTGSCQIGWRNAMNKIPDIYSKKQSDSLNVVVMDKGNEANDIFIIHFHAATRLSMTRSVIRKKTQFIF